MAESIAPLALASSTEDVAEAIIWLTKSGRTVTGELLLDGGIHLGSSKAQIPSKTACAS
jgi:3-oxoacyl-[acyl-carrier protein] reductase